MNTTLALFTPATFFTASSTRLAQLAQSTSILNDFFIFYNFRVRNLSFLGAKVGQKKCNLVAKINTLLAFMT
jgi:hypothetical protein